MSPERDFLGSIQLDCVLAGVTRMLWETTAHYWVFRTDSLIPSTEPGTILVEVLHLTECGEAVASSFHFGPSDIGDEVLSRLRAAEQDALGYMESNNLVPKEHNRIYDTGSWEEIETHWSKPE